MRADQARATDRRAHGLANSVLSSPSIAWPWKVIKAASVILPGIGRQPGLAAHLFQETLGIQVMLHGHPGKQKPLPVALGDSQAVLADDHRVSALGTLGQDGFQSAEEPYVHVEIRQLGRCRSAENVDPLWQRQRPRVRSPCKAASRVRANRNNPATRPLASASQKRRPPPSVQARPASVRADRGPGRELRQSAGDPWPGRSGALVRESVDAGNSRLPWLQASLLADRTAGDRSSPGICRDRTGRRRGPQSPGLLPKRPAIAVPQPRQRSCCKVYTLRR